MKTKTTFHLGDIVHGAYYGAPFEGKIVSFAYYGGITVETHVTVLGTAREAIYLESTCDLELVARAAEVTVVTIAGGAYLK